MNENSTDAAVDKGTDQNELETLARSIQQSHRACVRAVRKTLTHARAAGESLNRAKQLTKRGHWIAWVEDKCGVDRREAQRYMRIASGWDELTEKVDVANMTLTEALRVLSAGSVQETIEEEPAETKVIRPAFQIARPEFERKRSELDVLRSGGGTPVPAEKIAECAKKAVSELRQRVRGYASQLTKSGGDATLAAIAIAEAVRDELDPAAMFDIVDEEPQDSSPETVSENAAARPVSLAA